MAKKEVTSVGKLRPVKSESELKTEKSYKNEVKQFVDNYIENELMINTLDIGKTMYDSGVDSLELAEFEYAVEIKFGIKFEHGDFDIRNSFEFVTNKIIQRIGEQKYK